jgi:hypothetical protein
MNIKIRNVVASTARQLEQSVNDMTSLLISEGCGVVKLETLLFKNGLLTVIQYVEPTETAKNIDFNLDTVEHQTKLINK